VDERQDRNRRAPGLPESFTPGTSSTSRGNSIGPSAASALTDVKAKAGGDPSHVDAPEFALLGITPARFSISVRPLARKIRDGCGAAMVRQEANSSLPSIRTRPEYSGAVSGHTSCKVATVASNPRPSTMYWLIEPSAVRHSGFADSRPNPAS